MKHWLITGTNLVPIVVIANSFDKAIEKARKFDKDYNTGQLVLVIK